MSSLHFRPVTAELAINLYTGLISARRSKLQPALSAAVSEVGVATIDRELSHLVPQDALTLLAALGIRGERVFPTPSVIRHSPPLIGYYRMLLGISQKEFEQPQRLGYGPWVRAEQSGRLPEQLDQALDKFCKALTEPLVKLAFAMGHFDDRDLSDLTLLTLGPTLQGGRNNVIGSKAAQEVFEAPRSFVAPKVSFDSSRLVRFRSRAGLEFELVAGSDPDISIEEGSGNQTIPLLAIEVKGGRDASNAHNRAGEAEKSHIKAKLQGYKHRWTIIHMAKVDQEKICSETPSSTEVFEAADILKQKGRDWERLGRLLSKMVG